VIDLRMEAVFQGRQIPAWLRRFEAEPDEALHDLLLGRAFLGHLNADEPIEVLLDWLENLGDRSELPEGVDTTLARWIERNWGRFSQQASGASAALLATAWTRVANLIAFEPRLSGAARVLRSFFPERRSFLSALAEGRARDPEGRAWLAVAGHQEDRSLLLEWWRLCSLAPDVPWYHGIYGIHGLRGLPAVKRDQEGKFPVEVAEGLARLASGLSQRVVDGWLPVQTARGEFLRIARLTMDAYPLEDRWLSFWRHTLQRARVQNEEGRSWIQTLFPQELQRVEKQQRPGRQKRWMEPNPAWFPIVQEVVDRLRKMDLSVVDKARQLLGEQVKYAELTGDTHFVVRSACNFAARVKEYKPALALEWAELARRFDPWNAFAWTTTAAALLELHRLEEARAIAIGAVERFPENVVARNGLGEVLKAQGRLGEAEAIYRETVERFREDVVARNGLGEVLKAQGRLGEAEAIYRETVERFRENVVARTGLGEVLKAQGRLGEAEKIYEEAVERFPEAEVARTGLERVLKAQRRALEPVPESTEDITEGPQGRDVSSHLATSQPDSGDLLDSRDLEILLQDVYLLRRWSLHSDRAAATPGDLKEMARRKLRPLLGSENAPPGLVGEFGLLSLDTQDLEELLRLLQEAVKRYPGSARVRYSLACAEREAAARRQAVDRNNPEAPVLPWRRLSRLDERFVPLQFLGEARTWLLQTDGSLVAEGARDCLGQLSYRIQELQHLGLSDEGEPTKDSPSFIRWWSREIQNYVFGGIGMSEAEDLPDLSSIQSNIIRNAGVLNQLEEDWLQHWARA
jgi:Flp pilus assembly protein TadD